MRIPWAAVLAAAACTASPSPPRPEPRIRLDTTKDESSNNDDLDVLGLMSSALTTMQDRYFERWIGTWPEGIDWTRAVVNTHLVAALRTITDELPRQNRTVEDRECTITGTHHLISGYFADVIAYYFGENAFEIRHEAYDDMLWVVLSWLESIQFVKEHGDLLSGTGMGFTSSLLAWYGDRWAPAFAHRSRIFWELAARGWDDKYCDGGMFWSPRGLPYKNAVTNELFISSSIAMYLHFPGDPNNEPFGGRNGADSTSSSKPAKFDWRPHDPIFGKAAQNAHAWLTSSNMTNDQGLYTDGFHISGLDRGSNNTSCDERNEMVYTYNQGVILSGLLGLYQATNREKYLDEGHQLVENVIRATGFDLEHGKPFEADNIKPATTETDQAVSRLPPWRGLGRAGVLEDACDASGDCSQDSQTFKSIWMHHFAKFCAPDALKLSGKNKDGKSAEAAEKVRQRHRERCRRYIPWLRRNARAALGTRDADGVFGMWWTVGLLAEEQGKGVTAEEVEALEKADKHAGGRWPVGSVDYRNRAEWRHEGGWPLKKEQGNIKTETVADGSLSSPSETGTETDAEGEGASQKPITSRDLGDRFAPRIGKRESNEQGVGGLLPWDPNLRGRGRTLETQAGGLAVLRALWVVWGNERDGS
ncbi:hypothetical protein VTJ04DRAFT_1821 [Mycothermus thermophilus]|uniref:uncharacterized protein n=1 Tax=Humicola insolens TaxID=85995 RepID=UPI003743715D